jgi:hypothetical protein
MTILESANETYSFKTMKKALIVNSKLNSIPLTLIKNKNLISKYLSQV